RGPPELMKKRLCTLTSKYKEVAKMAKNRNSLVIKKAKGSNSQFAMIGERKVKFSPNVIKYLGLASEDIGKDSTGTNGIEMGIDYEEKELVIYMVPKMVGRVVGGSFENPETYCADICKDILSIIGEKLVNEGTVNFTNVIQDEFDDGTKIVVIDLTKYTANDGVFVKKIVTTNKEDK
ncbi:MAG: hypothetical protein ACI4TA_13635, partial [Acetatifactor sp.]